MGVTMADQRELTLVEVAARLRIGIDAARNLLKKGEIAARKQGRQWRVSESDLDEYIQRTRKEKK